MIIDEVPFTIVGVTAPAFHGIYPGQERELYAPVKAHIQMSGVYPIGPRTKWVDTKHYWVEILGWRKPAVSIAGRRRYSRRCSTNSPQRGDR